MTGNNIAKKRYRALDGWRGCLAFVVVIYHSPAGHLIPSGFLAVDFFFILSGFVLVHAFGASGTTLGFSHFFTKRVLRLWPLHLFLIGVAIAAYSSGIGTYPEIIDNYMPADTLGQTLIWDIFLLNNVFIPDQSQWGFNGVSWSISVELFAGIIIWLIVRYKIGWLGCLLFSLVCYGVIALNFQQLHVIKDDVFWPFNAGLARGFAGISLGAACYLVNRDIHSRYKNIPVNWTALEIGICLVAILAVLRGGHDLGDFACIFLFTLIIIVFSRETGFVSGLLNLSPFQFLGRISFALYLSHQIIRFSFPDQITGIGLLDLAVYFAVCIVIADLLNRTVETPVYNSFKAKAH